MAQFQLAPVPQPIDLFGFVSPHSQTIVMKEKFGDSFDINLLNGPPVLRVQGRFVSARGRKDVSDMNGRHLYQLTKEFFHIHATFVCKDQSERQLLQVKSGFALLGSKATATFTARSGQPVALTMKGSLFDTSADIVDATSGAVVARITRQFLTGREILLGQQTYNVTIAPGVDMALIVAMCIALDEKNNEGKGGCIPL